jgi:hypothetical protein
MMIDQVPAVLNYHEEYYVFASALVKLQSNVSRYPIPGRAVGMRLRDVSYVDDQGNIFEMSRVNATDKSFFQRTAVSNANIHTFYLEGNDMVITPAVKFNPNGFLQFYYYIRPNQLVDNTRAAITNAIAKAIIPGNKSYMPADVAGDTFTITSHGFLADQAYRASSSGNLPSGLATSTDYYLVSVTSNTFKVSLTRGGSPITTTTSGTGIHTLTRYLSQTNVFPSTAIDLTNNTITYPSHLYMNNDMIMFSSSIKLPNELSDGRIYFVVGATQNTFQVSLTSGGAPINLQSVGLGDHTVTSDLTILTCTLPVPANIVDGSVIDFLQTQGGHTILGIDVRLPDNSVSGSTITVRTSDMPLQFVVGDYLCLAKEAIIPYLPDDMHPGLAERACARVLSSINDKEGLALSNDKMARINKSEERLLNNRVEGSPEKIMNRSSILRYSRIGNRRRF